MALQGKNGKVGQDDDEHREEGGTPHLNRGFKDRFPQGLSIEIGMLGGEPPENVLHHDDGAIHNNAEIHGAQRQQIGRDAPQPQANKRCQQRERNDQGHNAGGSQMAEKKIKHHRDQQRAFQQVFEDCFEGRVD